MSKRRRNILVLMALLLPLVVVAEAFNRGLHDYATTTRRYIHVLDSIDAMAQNGQIIFPEDAKDLQDSRMRLWHIAEEAHQKARYTPITFPLSFILFSISLFALAIWPTTPVRATEHNQMEANETRYSPSDQL